MSNNATSTAVRITTAELARIGASVLEKIEGGKHTVLVYRGPDGEVHRQRLSRCTKPYAAADLRRYLRQKFREHVT